jgi:hypothetical protein
MLFCAKTVKAKGDLPITFPRRRTGSVLLDELFIPSSLQPIASSINEMRLCPAKILNQYNLTITHCTLYGVQNQGIPERRRKHRVSLFFYASRSRVKALSAWTQLTAALLLPAAGLSCRSTAGDIWPATTGSSSPKRMLFTAHRLLQPRGALALIVC